MVSPTVTVLFLHGFEQRRLGFGRGAVDFVGEHEVGEDRAGLELRIFAARRSFSMTMCADDVGGHQVGSELDARKLQVRQLEPECAPARSYPRPAPLPAGRELQPAARSGRPRPHLPVRRSLWRFPSGLRRIFPESDSIWRSKGSSLFWFSVSTVARPLPVFPLARFYSAVFVSVLASVCSKYRWT